MKNRQKRELNTLYLIINDMTPWDGLSNGVSEAFPNVTVISSDSPINPEVAYFKINGGGEKLVKVASLEDKILVNRLLKAKQMLDLMMTMWIRDITEGLLSPQELCEDGFSREADIIVKLLKDRGIFCQVSLGNVTNYINNNT